MNSWLPCAILFLHPLLYDGGVPDVLHTKQDILLLCVSTWALIRFFQGDLSMRGIKGSVWLLLLFVPTWIMETPFVLWFPPFSNGLMLWWWGVLLRERPSEPSTGAYTPSSLTILFKAVVCGATMLSLLTCLEAYDPSLFPWGGHFGGLTSATMGNPNHLGAYLSLSLPFFFLLGRYWLFCLPLVLYAIASTGSRLALLASVLPLASVGGWLLFQRHVTDSLLLPRQERASHHTFPTKKQNTNATRNGAVLSILAAIGLLTSSFGISPHKHLGHLPHGKGGWQARLSYLRCARPLVQEMIPSGLGLGRFAQRFATLRAQCTPKTARLEKTHTVVKHLHNDLAEFLLESGIWGIALLLWPLFRLWKSRPSWAWVKDPACAWLASVLFAYALHSLGSFPLQVSPVVSIAILAFVSLCHRTQNLSFLLRPERIPTKRKENSRNKASPFRLNPTKYKEKPPNNCRVWRQKGMAVVGVTLFISHLVLATQRHVAQRHLVQGTKASQRADPHALSLFQSSYRLFPSVHSHYSLAQYLMAIGAFAQAIHLLERALLLLPNPDIAATQAEAFFQQHHYAKAKKCLRYALKLAPHHQRSQQLQRLLLRQSQPRRKETRKR